MVGTKRSADSARESHQRKRTQDLPCPSWVFSSGSNTHVARDRSWFCDDYRPISSSIFGSPVIGIGTVLLPVKISPNAENREHATVKLRNVLHTPKAICNIVGVPICDDYDVVLGIFHNPANAGTITLPNGTAVGFFTFKSRLQLRLSGPPVGPHVGPSPFEPGTKYIIRAEWPSSERQKWLSSPRTPGPMAAPDRPSAEERKWLNMHYGNEHKFLAAHCLRIRDEEERHECL